MSTEKMGWLIIIIMMSSIGIPLANLMDSNINFWLCVVIWVVAVIEWSNC